MAVVITGIHTSWKYCKRNIQHPLWAVSGLSGEEAGGVLYESWGYQLPLGGVENSLTAVPTPRETERWTEHTWILGRSRQNFYAFSNDA